LSAAASINRIKSIATQFGGVSMSLSRRKGKVHRDVEAASLQPLFAKDAM
jgi:hypothetical protein